MLRKTGDERAGCWVLGIKLRQIIEHLPAELNRILEPVYSGVAVRVKGPVVESVHLGDQLFFGGFLASDVTSSSSISFSSHSLRNRKRLNVSRRSVACRASSRKTLAISHSSPPNWLKSGERFTGLHLSFLQWATYQQIHCLLAKLPVVLDVPKERTDA